MHGLWVWAGNALVLTLPLIVELFCQIMTIYLRERNTKIQSNIWITGIKLQSMWITGIQLQSMWITGFQLQPLCLKITKTQHNMWITGIQLQSVVFLAK